MRGGKRPHSGRPKGSRNYPRAAAALLQAAFSDEQQNESGDQQTDPIATMRGQLVEFGRLAATAKQAGDMGSYKYWTKRVGEVCRDLTPYLAPKLQAVMTSTPTPDKVDFFLNVFERERRLVPPQQIEAKPIAADPTPSPDTVDDTVTSPYHAEPEAKAEEAKPEPPASPSPPPTPPPDQAPGPSWAEPKSLFQHPSLQGSWLRGSWRN
jgi:hypothetical protein